MQPIQYPTSSFSRDQRSKTKVSYWDTTCTVPQTGITVALFDLLDWSVDLLSTSLSTKAAIEAMLNNTSKVSSVLGTSGGAYRTGLEPNIVKYWGTGTFPGGKIPQRAVIKYSGTVIADDVAAHPVTLVFGGYGKIRVFKNGTEIVNGVIREPLTHAAPDTDLNTIEREAGYQIVETSVTAGDLIDIYYVQNGEPWGGFFAKVIPQQGLTTSWTAFRAALMEAGIVSASFIAASAAVEQNVPYVVNTEVQAGVQQIRQATVEVALNDAGRWNGFLLENVGGMNQLTDNGDGSLVIRPGRRIYCEGGFARQAADEMYPRFMGRVVSITPSADETTATILCQGFENRLDGEIDESYPDPISYLANGFINREWLGYPVFGIPAFDAWPMEVAIAHLNARAGVDSYNLGKSPYTANPTYGRWTYVTSIGQVIYLGQKRFSARALSDSTQFIYLQRNTNYGNVGVLQKDYLRKDDPYIFPSRVSDRLYDRVSLLASQYGYDFFFDAQGQATIRSRNNPQSWQYLSQNGDTNQSTNPSAIGGRYFRELSGVLANNDWYKRFTTFASRVDLYLGLGKEALTTSNGGMVSAQIDVANRNKSLFNYDPGDVVAGETFTRTGTANFLTASNGWFLAATGQKRDWHYLSGKRTLLLESASTNSCVQSKDLTQSAWIVTNASGTRAFDAVGLNGSANSATTLNDTSTTGSYSVKQTFNTTSGVVSTYSIAVKKDAITTRFPSFFAISGTNIVQVNLNTSTGTKVSSQTGGSSRILDGGLWWIVEVVLTAAATTTSIEIYPAYNSSNILNFVANATGSIVVGNVNVELGKSFSTSPIFTTTGAVTRNADSCTYPGVVCPTGSGTLYQEYYDVATGTFTQSATAYTSGASITLTNDRAYTNVMVLDGTYTVPQVAPFLPQWMPVQTTSISTYNNATESFFYDDLLLQNGQNASVVTLFNEPFDQYRVTLTPNGLDLQDLNTSALVRLNGIAVFERDPSTSPYPQNLSTLSNVMELKPISNEKDMRNQVIVVGQRKATVTDSDKFQADDNPNNPFTEFYVSVAADPLSIYDPTATNFLGGKKVTVIVDEKVTDGDFAKWLARTVLYRSNMPTNSAEITTTPLPMIEIRDAIRVVNEKQDNIPTTVWVESFREKWPAEGDAEVEITLTAYQELPSYTPREDLDISLFQNSPAFRISASYKNIYGNSVSNPAMPTTMPTMSRSTTAVTNATSMTLPTSWAPDDLHLQHSTFTGNKKYLINHPYRHFYHISNISGSGGTRTYTTTFDFQEGDGTASVYDKTYYGFITNWSISGDAYVDRSAGAGTSATINPFYDPYSSEVNNLVSLKFDTLVSGFYRVSLWAATNKGEYDFPVAWLTKPDGDPEDVEAHWSYMEAGAGRELLWDGVDNVGLWNRYQTADYARMHDGSFLDKPVAVGKGFYAHNDQSTDIQTQIGDQVSLNYDAAGMPFFVKGRYARFYLKIEAKSDRLTRASQSQTIFEVNSHNQLKVISTPFYIFTHLGEPSQSTMVIEEWDDTVDKWVQGTVLNHWSTINQASGNPEIRHGKPVRVSFTPIARRGVLFFNEVGVADNDRWSGQLTRVAHMKVNTFDQFWTFSGVPWDGDINEKNKSYNNASNQEAKRLTNRMNSDDTHTVTFDSDAWMTGKDMKAFQWIFHPDFFKKDFGGGFEEAIRYGDYEQLYSLPGYDYKQGGGTSRKDKAFINMAFMNYLFYLSAMTMDRSGRRQWCINPNFVDKSKIVSSTWLAATQATNPAYALQYERFGAANYLQRTVFVRQWIEPTWKVSSGGFLSGSPVDPAHLGTGGISNSFQLQWVQPSILDFDPTSSPMASTGTEDMWMTAYTTQNSQVMKDFWLQAASFLSLQVRPFYTGMPSHTHNYAVTAFGAWGFDRYIYSGWFKPSPCRDFHPYWREPGMPDWATAWPGYTLDTIDAPNVGVNIMEAPASHYASAMRDIAAQANWFGFAYSDAFNPGTAGSNLNWRGARLEEDVIAWAKQGNKFTEFANVFDYVKQDTLNRFDHYRGVISRSPLAKRTSINAATDLDWWKSSESRQAGAQATSPSGVYLMNLGNYNDYVIAPCTSKQYREDANFMHFTHDVTKFYDIRFRHEFVWQNSRYFPVYPNGGAKYWAFQSERHGLSTSTGVDLYDAGAWTGWKDDITSASWSGDSHLRWSELFGATGTNTNQARIWNDGSVSTKSFYSGGYGVNSVGGALAATGAISYQQKVMGTNSNSIKWFTRANIFADEFGSGRMRLAVGPRTPETRSLTMNLVLPYRLSH
jgi:hypothetical protein